HRCGRASRRAHALGWLAHGTGRGRCTNQVGDARQSRRRAIRVTGRRFDHDARRHARRIRIALLRRRSRGARRGRHARHLARRRLRRSWRRFGRSVRTARGTRGTARRCRRMFARGHQQRLAQSHRPGRPDRHAHRPRHLHRLWNLRGRPARASPPTSTSPVASPGRFSIGWVRWRRRTFSPSTPTRKPTS
ncbi:MAG: hypothetical protein RIQ63_1089, partial [Actinomycetota bacterium]